MATTTKITAEQIAEFLYTAPGLDRDCCAFARATTKEIADALGADRAVVLKACQAAARKGLIEKAGRAEAGGYQGRVNGSVGYQLWEVNFSDESPCRCASCREAAATVEALRSGVSS